MTDIKKYIVENCDLNRISVQYRNERSYNGYSLDVCKSALQKYIRRGEVDKAIYMAIEVYLFTLLEDSTEKKRVLTNLIHRLQVIYLEDLGLAGYEIWDKVDIYFDKLINRDDSVMLEILINLVVTFAKNKHSRSISHYNSLRTVYKSNENREKIDRYLKYFPKVQGYFDLVKENTKYDEYSVYETGVDDREIDIGYWVRELEGDDNLKVETIKKIFKPLSSIKFATIANKWTKELNGIKERFLPYLNVLLYNLCKRKVPESEMFKLSSEEIFDKVKINIETTLEIDSYVLDMHTKNGKRKGMSVKEFVYEGSIVDNEWLVNKEWSDFYNFTKLLFQADIVDKKFLDESRIKKKTKESDIFEFIVRAQLVTSASKPDSYFVIDKRDGKHKFVKGPYLNKEKIDVMQKIKRLREILDEVYIEFEVIKLVPDLLKSAISTRNKIEKGKEYWFVVFENMFACKFVNNIHIKVHSSKLWPETEIIDLDEMKMTFNPLTCKPEIFEMYVRHMLFRYMAGIGDLADRNFFICFGILYSVDEESIDYDINILKQLKQSRADRVKLYIKNNKKDIKEVIDDWINRLKKAGEDDILIKRLKNINFEDF